MKTILRTVLAVVAGMALALALVIAVEILSSIVHPLPSDFKETMEEMCQHVANYPHWILGVVVFLWSGTAFISTWVATKIGRLAAGAVVALLLMSGIGCNIAMLPYAMWFKVVMPSSSLMACYWGVRLGGRVSVKTLAENAE